MTVPGTLRGFLHIHRRLGSLPLDEVIALAVSLARDGVEVTEHQSYVTRLLIPINSLTEEASRLYLAGGDAPKPGERLRNSDLANFLETLSSGGEREFYSGEIVEQIDREMRENGGLLTRMDLDRYRVAERPPLSALYRGHELLTNPAPSFGGTLIALSLSLYDSALPRDSRRYDEHGSVRPLCALAAVMEEVESLRGDATSPTPLPAQVFDAAIGRIQRSAGGNDTHQRER